METADEKDRAHFFKIERVEVDAKGLNINLKQSKRKFLFNLVKPLLLKFVRPVLEKVLEKQIKDQINELDEVAWKIYKEADRAQQEAKDNPDPANLQNIYQRYVNAAQQQFFHRKRQAEEVAKDKKVNVAVTKQDSMFKNISLPGGISTKATEYKELAAQGDKWESPVFSIGSSGESSNLPKASSVSRRSQRTSGGVSGGTGGYATGTSHSGYGTGSTGTAAGTGVGNDYGTSTGARTGHSAGTGYSAGTGNSVGQGYSTSTGTGTGTHGVVGGTTNNSNQAFVNGNPSQSTTAGFSNQVNQAFGDSGNTGDYRLNQDGTKNTQNTTTLGSNNPVLTGNV